ILANQPPPKGDRVAIVTNAGGLGILCADTCEANGLHVNPLGEATRRELRSFLPAEASVGNPVDMIASATGEDYRRAITTVANDPDVDAMIVIYIPPQATKAAEIGRAIAQGISEAGGEIPIATTWMSTKGLPPELRGGDVTVPSFAFPESAAIAMAHACEYGRWRERPRGAVPTFEDVSIDEAFAILADALGRGGDGWLSPDEVERLFACYGLRTA